MAVKIVAEIGINHRGSLKVAYELIDQAVSSKCWGVKFQYRHLDSFYQSTSEIGDGIIFEELERIDLTLAEYIDLAKYAHKAGIKVGVSFFRTSDFYEFSSALDFFDFFKVPSAECINIPLLKTLIATDKLVMVSTGGHTLEQIEKNILPLASDKLVIFHCVANYPSKLGVQNLNFVKTLGKIGFNEVGYSSHDEDIEVCLIAMSLGIGWLERHLTQDVSGQGLDDSSSSEVADFRVLSRFGDSMPTLMGGGGKLVNQGEILNMQNLGTGLYMSKDTPVGASITLNDCEIKAPRVGLSAGVFLDEYVDRTTTVPLAVGQPLTANSFSTVSTLDKPSLFKFANRNQIGIPVRLHDFCWFKSLIKTGVYEFHLSYQECLAGDFVAALASIDKSDRISIHLPDYLPGNHILDPVSDDLNIRGVSRQLISRVTDFARSISHKIGKNVPIVGSFSQTNGRMKNVIMDDLFDYIDHCSGSEFQVLPQWLPVYAWYFGGAVKLDLFNSLEDIEYLTKNSRAICLDICHLGLSAKYANTPWEKWYELLAPLNNHTHLADSVGIDGEGLPLGTGDIGDFNQFLGIDGLKIIEVWQGHFNDGEGFLTALHTLQNN